MHSSKLLPFILTIPIPTMNESTTMVSIPTDKCACLCYIPTLALIIWISLSFNLKRPRCYLQEFYVPALDLSQNVSNTTTLINPSLFFNMALKNILKDRSIRYGDVNLTFSYGQNAVANYIVPSFYQGKGKTEHRREAVEASGMPWDDALRVVLNGSKAVFRVDLEARLKFKFWFWYSKRKGVKIGANVEVDGFGMKVKKDDIKLSFAPSSSKPNVGLFVLVPSLVVTLFVFY